jgi:hypothetical protein
MSMEIGDETELADIWLQDARRLALFSVKSGTIPEHTMASARSREKVVEWYEKALFGQPHVRSDGQHQREGALRRLDTTAREVLAGKHKPAVHPGMTIFPVVVTYDELGGDNVGMYRWVAARCNMERLFRPSRVRPVTFISVRRFEQLMALGGKGRNILDILDRKTRGQWVEARLEVMLDQTESSRETHGDPELARLFDEIIDDMNRSLFPRESGHR